MRYRRPWWLAGLIATGCAAAVGFGVLGPSPFELGEERFLTTDPAKAAGEPAAAWNGEDYLVVWSIRWAGGTDLQARHVGPRGDFAGRAPWFLSSAPGEQRRPAVAWGGGYFLAVWEDSRNGSMASLYGARITADGTLLDPSGFQIARSNRPQLDPLVAWTGDGFYVLWHEDEGGGIGLDLYGALVDSGAPGTQRMSEPLVAAPGDQRDAAMAWGGEHGVVVWSDQRAGQGDQEGADLYALRLSPQGRRLDVKPLVVSRAEGGERSPAVAWSRGNFFVVWVDRRLGHDELFGARLAPNGHLWDPGGVRLTKGLSSIGTPVLLRVAGGLLAGWPNMGGPPLLQAIFWQEGFRDGEGDEAVASAVVQGTGGNLVYLQSAAPQMRMAATFSSELLLLWTVEQSGQFEPQIVLTTVMVAPSGT